MTAPPSGRDRNRLRSTTNLWRALIPLVLGIGVLVLLSWPRSPGLNTQTVDAVAIVSGARQQTGLKLMTPTGLAAGWRCTSGDLRQGSGTTPSSLLLSYQSPTGGYSEVLESADAADAVLAGYGTVTAAGDRPISGTNWQSYRTTAQHLLLRHTFGAITVIVTGAANADELSTLAASVR